VSTASPVPETHDLEGDDAFETLRNTGLRDLAADAFVRFRAADGFSHARALAFQFTLTLLPALIALVGFATVLDQQEFKDVLRDTLTQLSPGPASDVLTQAFEQGSESGETALLVGLIAALVAGTTAMGQMERGANRIYGIERDRPPLRKYLTGFGLMCSAGLLTAVALVLFVAGFAIDDAVEQAVGWGDGARTAWEIGRWPAAVALVVAAIALLFKVSPHRRQPEVSWLAFGSGLAVLLWLGFTGALALYLAESREFGETYGPLAGTIGVLLWTMLTSVALFAGLAFAAQLEAVRAGTPEPRVRP
jgi:YihY family inner membrane protein